MAVSGCLLTDDFEKVPAATGGGAPVPDCPSLFWGEAPADCVEDLLYENDACCVAGRSCMGADCVNGRCRPGELGSSPENTEALGIVVVGEWVVWTTGNGGQVLAVPRTGGSSPAELAAVDPDAGEYATHIATDGTHVYWVDYGGGRIHRAEVGASGTQEVIAEVAGGYGGWGRIAVRDGLVFWALADSEGIWLANADGSSSEPTMIAEAEVPYGVAVDDTHVYWSERGSDTAATGRILRLARADIATSVEPDELETAEDRPTEIALDDTHVYWLTDGGGVSRIAKDGNGSIEDLSAEEHEPAGIRVDDVFVYWTDPEDSALRRVRKDGSGYADIVQLDNGIWPQGLDQDCDTLYFTADDSKVRMVTK